MHLLSRTARFLTVAAFAAITLPSSLAAAIFLELKGPSDSNLAIVGESTVAGFAGQVEITSCQVGASNTFAQGSRGFTAGKPSLSEVTITKHTDRSSPKFFGALAVGGRYNEGIVSFTKADSDNKQVAYFKVELRDVVVPSWSASSGGDQPTESVALAYSAIRYTYIPLDATGKPGAPVTSEWNLTTNRPEFRSKDASVAEPVVAGDKPASTGTEITVEE